MRSELTPKDLICIRRSAEDAAYAMNRNHKPFIEAVSHPLNIIALVDMAQSSLSQQSGVEELQKRVDAVVMEIEKLHLSGVIGFGTVKRLEQALTGGESQ